MPPRLLFALFIFAQAPLFAAQFHGKVVGVADGDTLTVLRDGRGEKVRLYGIDCPEKRQPFGRRAKEFTAKLCFGKPVTVEIVGRDRYGRTVGKVYLADGRLLNHELVKAGMAWWYRPYAKDDPELERLEREVRAARQGLWADPKPVPPWDFRRRKRPPV